MWRSINLCKLLEVSIFLIPRPVIRVKRRCGSRLRASRQLLLAIRPLVARAKRRCGSRLRVSLQPLLAIRPLVARAKRASAIRLREPLRPLLAIRNKKPFDCSKGSNLYQTNNWRRS